MLRCYHWPVEPLDLGAYLRRIGWTGSPRPDLLTLRAWHRAHLGAIAFENLDIQMGLRIRLDLASLQDKMVQRRRGGYCHEHNTLFRHVLEAAGFEVAHCEARVRQSAGSFRPRTHLTLKVPCEGRTWLADVGFGGDGPLEPVPLDGETSEQFGDRFRVVPEGSLAVLQRLSASGWEDLYAIEPRSVHPVDVELATWFTSTHPSSPFVNTLTAQRTTPGARQVLRNLAYTVTRGADVTTRAVERAALAPLLRDAFGLDVPENATFRAIDGLAAPEPRSAI